jgi:hypothetical protein
LAAGCQEDPLLVSKYGVAAVTGLQGADGLGGASAYLGSPATRVCRGSWSRGGIPSGRLLARATQPGCECALNQQSNQNWLATCNLKFKGLTQNLGQL